MIRNLHLTSVRNISELDISFEPGITVVSGKNGCGKTTLLEIIHVLSHGYSFRSRDLKELVSWNAEELIVRGTFLAELESTRALSVNSLTGIVAKKDGLEAKSASLFFGQIPAVIMQPSDISLVRGAPRRTPQLDGRNPMPSIAFKYGFIKALSSNFIATKSMAQAESIGKANRWRDIILRFNGAVY